MGTEPTAIWQVALREADRSVLEAAFERDPELRLDVGFAFMALVELGVHDRFVRAFVTQLRQKRRSAPALAVLPAAASALEGVQCRR